MNKGLMIFVALALSTPIAHAEPQGRLSTVGAVEAWDANKSPLHVIAMVAYDLSGLKNGSRVSAVFNTDTLRLEYDGLRLSPRLEFGSRLTGEYKIANLLSDYFRAGENDLSRTFYSSYVQGQAWLKWNPLQRTYVSFELGARRWFFAERGSTDPDLILPEDAFVLEPRLYLTWWGLADDAGWRDRHRVFPHLSGVAVGASIALNYQHSVRPWGARNVAAFDPIDPRNTPEQVQVGVTQWLKGGWHLGQPLRIELSQELGWMTGEDDLTRRNIGGMNPYTVNVPGVPWAYFHSGDYGSAMLSLHWALTETMEIGPVASVVGLRDGDRVGSTDVDVVWGAGGLLGWRSGPWQADIRGGFSPGLQALHPNQGAWSAFMLVGWASQ